jgi:hypothetical protein
MLALNRSLLNRECTPINILKALVSIISMCGLHVIFLTKITPPTLLFITSWHGPLRKHRFFLRLLPLPSNGCYITAYFADVA